LNEGEEDTRKRNFSKLFLSNRKNGLVAVKNKEQI